MAYPYIIWAFIMIVTPMMLILLYAFTTKGNDVLTFQFSFGNFLRFFSDDVFPQVLLRSLKMAFVTTLFCILIGYPCAYFIAKMKPNSQGVMILLITLPMWINVLVRTYAWRGLLGYFDLSSELKVYIGMVYNFLPFMILPIYTVLVKMDTDLINAASDLGATKSTIFRKIIFPLSMPGVISGITMVFMPAVSTFVISRILGGGQYMLLGNLIQTQYTTMGDWNFGSAIAIFMMIIILISMAFMNKFEGSDDKEGGSRLW